MDFNLRRTTSNFTREMNMTLLQLAHHKEMSIQAVCHTIKKQTGENIPCNPNQIIPESIIEVIDSDLLKDIKAKGAISKGPIELFDSDKEELIIAVVRSILSDCIILSLLDGETITLQKDCVLGYEGEINEGDIVTLNSKSDFKILNIQSKKSWQKEKIIHAYETEKIIHAKILYPYQYHGYFVNIYGVRALMYNNQISDASLLISGNEIDVIIQDCNLNSSSYYVIVSQKRANDLCKQKKAMAIKEEYDNIQENDILNTTIEKIEANYIIVRFNNLKGLVHREDLFWCKVKDINKHIEVGESIKVKVISKSNPEQGVYRIQFSHKEFTLNPWETSCINELDEVNGSIVDCNNDGYTIKIAKGIEGTLSYNNMTKIENEALKMWTPDQGNINLSIKSIDRERKLIELCIPISQEIKELWENIDQYFEVDKTYKGKIISTEKNDFRVQLRDGIEASIPENELSWPKCSVMPMTDFQKCQQVNVIITQINQSERKIIASIRLLIPNPWEIAKLSMSKGSTCIVRITGKKNNYLFVETQNQFHLIGIIEKEELSWMSSDQIKEPQIEEVIEAKVILFDPEKYKLRLSVRQLKDTLWNELYLGAQVYGTILPKEDFDAVLVQLDNNLEAQTSELNLRSQAGQRFPFKIVKLNPATGEIKISKHSLDTDKKNEAIVKSFFK